MSEREEVEEKREDISNINMNEESEEIKEDNSVRKAEAKIPETGEEDEKE